MSHQENTSMMDFFVKFKTDDDCREYLYAKRWPNGFICPKCGVVDNPFMISSRKTYQCKHCTHQTTVTAGTIFDKTRTPLQKWFLAIYLMGNDKRGCSALRLQKELRISYNTAWTMSHKIRSAMKERDEDYQLQGFMELDEGFFGTSSEGEGKRGRGTDKLPVAVALSLDEKGNPQFIKAKVLGKVDGDAVSAFAENAFETGASVSTDGLTVYNKLAEKGFKHILQKFEPASESEHLRWLHIVISNMKAFINGTYHGVPKKHFQAFVDEFCYRFNRRFWPNQMFARTIVACANATPFRNYELVG
jgi:transposase-like protein